MMARSRRAVFVCCDGLGRDWVRPESTPVIEGMRRSNLWCADHRAVFPSVTRVSAASIATGCHPARHGLHGNRMGLFEEGRIVVRDVGAQIGNGDFGDGIVVVQDQAAATLALAGSRIEASVRAGLSVFSATATVGSATVECNAFDVDGEAASGPFALTDEGGNVCGCGGARSACQVVSSNLSAPAPIGGGKP